jgi:TonB-linked SusC/RagA family outer membrane protein
MKEVKQLKKQNLHRLMLAFLATIFTLGIVNAQTKFITGIVKDSSGETIIGASVLVKGTNVGTITDINGKFKINAPINGKTLVVSYIGMEKNEVPIRGEITNITLQNIDKSLDEVVVIGYGTQKKRDLTGSVASVGEKAMRDIPVSTAAEALTGKLTGVQVTTTEGSPDAEIKIRVRGGGSITQSNAPLYIVDGFAKDDIKDIAPSEISTIDVLKDASSTAIYGSRGANGVIIITTKSAQLGKMSISYNGYVGFKNVAKTLDVLSPYQFAQKQYERAVWGGASKVTSEYENYFGSFDDMNLYQSVNGTNWQNETFGNTGVNQNHAISLNGGNKKFSYNASFSHIYDKAIMYMSNYKRDNLSLKLKYSPTKWLKLDFATRYAGTVINGSGANDQTGTEKSTSDSRVKNAIVYTPIPLKNLASQDDDVEATASLFSPLLATEDNNRLQNNSDFNINGGATFTIAKGLTFNTTFGIIRSNKDDKRFMGLTSYYAREGGAMKRDNATAPVIFLRNTNIKTIQNTNVINYKKDNIIKGHNLSLVLGQETYIKSSDYQFQDIEALPRDYNSFMAWDDPASGTSIPYAHFYNPDERLFSYFGRLNYDINDKYLFAFTFRTDGSSKFSNGNEWGYFPSASAGWRISDEGFMNGTQKWLSNLKLRASFGKAGNNRIDDSAFRRVYSASHSNYLESDIFSNIYTAGTTLANPDLKWETTTTRNVGLDYGFFKNRINGTLEMYSNTTDDALIRMNIGGVGYTDQWQNTATTTNRGVELNMNIALVQKKDFTLNFSFNISANKNKVEKLGNLASYPFNEAWTSSTTASNSYIVKPGEPVGIIYGFQSDGMYNADDFTWSGTKWVMNATKYNKAGLLLDGVTTVYTDDAGNMFVDNSSYTGLSWGPGAMKLKDMNGDGKITLDDKTKIGDTNPKHFGAFSLNGSYKGFDASVNFNWVYGNQIYNANKIELTSGYYKYRNNLAITANAYSQIDWLTGERISDTEKLNTLNANATIWSASTAQSLTTSWAIEDGSFLRLNNLTVGYTIPKNITKKWYIQQLRVFASGYNLHVWTNYSGYDPEVDTRRSTPATPGVDYSAYPKSSSYNLGVNITF